MKNKQAIRLLLLANFISGVAQGISMIAVPMYFAATDAVSWFTLMYAGVTMVSVFWSPYAGTLVDKYNRKYVFLWINLICGLLLGGISLAGWALGGVNAWLALGAFAMTFWNYNIHYSSFYAFLQEMSEPEHYPRIASTIEIQTQLATAFSAAGAAMLWKGGDFAGISFPKLDLHWILALDAATYFVAFGLIAMLRFVPVALRKIETGGLLERLRTGWEYLRGESKIFLFGVLSQAVFVMIILHAYTLSPLYVKDHLHTSEEVFAWSELFYALGAMGAGIFAQRVFKNTSAWAAIIWQTLATAALCLGLIWSSSIFYFYAFSVLTGLTNAGIRVLRVSYLFSVVPNQVAGRVNSIFGVSNLLMRAAFLGLFSLPFFGSGGHVVWAFGIFALFFVWVSAWLYARR